MTELLTAAQMRAIEQAAIDSGEVTGLELMERAGQGVVEAIFEEWPELAESEEGGAAPRPADSPRDISGKRKRAVVLCGPGNNGGDGFVVARLLDQRGWDVDVFLYGEADKLPPDARVNFDRWRELNGRCQAWLSTIYDDDGKLRARLLSADVTVDAVFGTGLSRGLGRIHNDVWSAYDLDTGALNRLVAVDIPSGLCSDSGKLLDFEVSAFGADENFHAFQSALTVTFHRAKLGHYLAVGAALGGRVVVKDIGLSSITCLREACVQRVASDRRASTKIETGHKFLHGHALVFTGGLGKTGAARLSARGALRIGAGLVTLGVPPSAQMEVSGHITALMMSRVNGGGGLEVILEDERLNALCLGPGLGQARARDLVPVALAAKRATVLDADALSAFADEPEVLFALLHEGCVLTPHGGEFARLFPDIADKLNETPIRGPAYSKVDATREAAKRAGCVVLFKGPDTVIADPQGCCSINSAHYERSAPWLATAGSGDVLAGFITGLLARGFAPMQAAEMAAWLHVECALEFGPGLIAEDLPEQLPAVFQRLGV
ncbi:Bifunctional NAD(P)H-hydrate repair enzyme Nnr [Falsiruegeria litorea R37]|uniref:Bifunctional NAD(P)H-hydrate repair enzyme n=1 Tax=Falsiruegeria litorea R37 TaxID=1200284 RepID=A0A1Y5SP19_9RHOB|nr:NAD(P)H-hydrate dehydratase [Falsiruegeria litorea]SLN45151.1 Bifunctional NAD(P)H-hydrate repair enzyme Nnr [Falsiruegeria litorea R37]